MRRLSILCVVAAVVLAAPGCSSDSARTVGQPDVDNTIVPDSTTPAPGVCEPLDHQIPPPTIIVDGKRTDATFGIGVYQCSSIAGNGYIINNYNPVLIDASAPVTIEVAVNSDATVKLALGLGGEFTQTGDRAWSSTAPLSGCDRLTITLKSPSGASRATFGADIRVGGESTDCPQRVIDPTDVGAIVSVPDSIPDLSDNSIDVTDPTDRTVPDGTDD